MGIGKLFSKVTRNQPCKRFLGLVKAAWDGEAAWENSAVGESESNGKIEKAIQILEGELRILKDALETNLGKEVPAESRIMSWLTVYASVLLRRGQVGADGKTPFQRIRGRSSRRPLALFGESVWYLPLHNKGSTLDVVKEEGFFIGILDRSDEVILLKGDGSGIVKAKDIRRKPEDERWDADKLLGIQFHELYPNGDDSGDVQVKTYIQPGLANPSLPRAVAEEVPFAER